MSSVSMGAQLQQNLVDKCCKGKMTEVYICYYVGCECLLYGGVYKATVTAMVSAGLLYCAH